MKTLQTDTSGNNYTLVAPTPSYARDTFPDPWPSHATGGVTLTTFRTAAGFGVIGGFFTLTDMSSWAYFSATLMDPFGCENLLLAVEGYQVANYPGDWTGEGFNALLRPLLDMKLTSSDFAAWLGAH